MNQTSSPTLLREPISSIHEMTSGSERGYYTVKTPAARTLSAAYPSHAERPLEQPSMQHSDYISDQGWCIIHFDSYGKATVKLILLQPKQYSDARIEDSIQTRPGVSISSLIEKQEGSPSHIPQLEIIRWIRTKTGLSLERIGQLLGVRRQTLYNWAKGETISDQNRQRLLQIKDVLERAASRHTTPASLTLWLDTPRGAEGYTPAQLLEKNEIGKARLFAVSNPSPRLKRPPAWTRRPVPEAFKAGEEHYDEALPPEVAEDITTLDAQGTGNSTILDNDTKHSGS